MAAGSDQSNGGSISFGLSLAATPRVTIIPVGGPTTTECSGIYYAPTATSGNLCIYELSTTNNSGISSATSNFGTEFFIHSVASGRFGIDGTWAVTG